MNLFSFSANSVLFWCVQALVILTSMVIGFSVGKGYAQWLQEKTDALESAVIALLKHAGPGGLTGREIVEAVVKAQESATAREVAAVLRELARFGYVQRCVVEDYSPELGGKGNWLDGGSGFRAVFSMTPGCIVGSAEATTLCVTQEEAS